MDGGVRGIDGFVAIADDAEIKARFATLALTEPNARANTHAGDVGVSSPRP
jgi:hypothetical protein